MTGPTGAAVVAGVVGWPVRHSLSPLIHGAWLAAAGVDGVYAPFAVPPARFDGFVAGLRGGAVAGLNVTLPHKARACELADARSPSAEAAGAANLLLFEPGGGLHADNTDGAGLVGAPREADALRGPVLLLGAGGAARGAAAALLDAGVADLRIANRTPARALALAAHRSAASAYGLDALDAAADGAALVVNATSAGLTGEPPALPWARLVSGATAMDMVYVPLETPFLAAARAHGLRTLDGLAMLIGQARPSFIALYGRPPPVETDVRRLCLRALDEARARPAA